MSDEPLAFTGAQAGAVVHALYGPLLRGGVALDIHADDEMLRFLREVQHRDLDEAAAVYLQSGRVIWDTFRQVLRLRFGGLDWGGAVLDFASGYGRVSRHAVLDLGPERLWVSDIYAGGVAFQERLLGVHGLVSCTDPREFACARRFDAILVSSLFTHLGEERFLGWLERLGGLLSDGGLLVFSVHDQSLLPADERAVAPPGLFFQELSESGSLAKQEYGTSWVSEAFVRGAIARALGPWPVSRFARGLASFQDLYVVMRPDAANVTGEFFADFRLEREADGFFESCHFVGRRGVQMSGWAADRISGAPPAEVRVRVGGALLTLRDLAPRPDLAAAYPHDALSAVGWSAEVELAGSLDETAALRVTVLARGGEERELYRGTVGEALLRSALLDLKAMERRVAEREAQRDAQKAASQAERTTLELALQASERRNEELQRRLAAMTGSRFWKLRDFWFAVKRSLKLTDER